MLYEEAPAYGRGRIETENLCGDVIRIVIARFYQQYRITGTCKVDGNGAWGLDSRLVPFE